MTWPLTNCSNASWFIQDGARAYRTPAIFDFLSEQLNDRVISLYYDMHLGRGIKWLPYLTPCDFFLNGGGLKSVVYRQIPPIIAELNNVALLHVKQFQLTYLHEYLDIIVSDIATLLQQILVILKISLFNFFVTVFVTYLYGCYLSYFATPSFGENSKFMG